MVEDFAIQRPRGGDEPPGCEAIGSARPAIAARMIVRQQDPHAAVRCCVTDDRPRGKVCAARVPFVPRQMNAVQLAIDVRDPQALSSGIGLGEAACEERAGRIRSVQLERLCGTLIAHPLSMPLRHRLGGRAGPKRMLFVKGPRSILDTMTVLVRARQRASLI